MTEKDPTKEIDQFLWQSQISELQKQMAIKMATDYNLSPLKREIHFIPFYNSVTGKNDLQPVVAYTEYIKKAQATWQLDWYNYEIWIETTESRKDMYCKVTVYRKDRTHPLVHTVRYSEVAQLSKDGTPNKNRKTKPKFMIMKVWIAQAMRLAFPEDVGWMPYEVSEVRNTIETWENKESETTDTLAI